MRVERIIATIDTHTGGQPTRTVIGGLPHIPGKTIVEKMNYMKEKMDWVRTALMFEPRGHSAMSGAVLTEPTHPDADIGVFFIQTDGYMPMCGHSTIGVSTALVETGMVKCEAPVTHITFDTPAGLTRVRVNVENGIAKGVTLRNIPSFLFAADVVVNVPELGSIRMDIAYGGNFYAILPASAVGLEIAPENASQLIEKGRRIKDAVNSQVKIRHPEKEFINHCPFVEFYGQPTIPGAHVKNAAFFPESGIDRSPCGTGTSAKVATLYAKGKLKLNEEFVHESIIGSIFRARAVEETRVGPYLAVVPEVTGRAHLIASNQFLIDPDDPHKNGFLLD